MGGEGVWEGYGDLHTEKTTRLASWVGMGGDRAGIDRLGTDSQLGYIACTSLEVWRSSRLTSNTVSSSS